MAQPVTYSNSTTIAVLSDCPFGTTGFGTVAHSFSEELAKMSYVVYCFALNCSGSLPSKALGYKVFLCSYPVESPPARQLFKQFLNNVQPKAVILFISSSWIHQYVPLIKLSVELGVSVLLHVVLEGDPISREAITILSALPVTLLAATKHTTEYLRSKCNREVHLISQAVDKDRFKQLIDEERQEVRRALNFDDKFIIGVFGRNIRRKQIPRVLEGCQILIYQGMVDLFAYLHCQHERRLGGWPLDEIIERLGISAFVGFPNNHVEEAGIINSEQTKYDEYAARVSACDLILNCSSGGGFELGILEAQACGVPLLCTDDKGNMAEVAGDGAILLPADRAFSIEGAFEYYVQPFTIADSIRKLRQDASLRESLVSLGLQNVSLYSWTNAAQQLVQIINSVTLVHRSSEQCNFSS